MDTPPLDQTVPHDELARCLQGLCKVASDGLTGVLGVAGCPGWPRPAGGAGAPGRGGCFRLGVGGPDEPALSAATCRARLARCFAVTMES